MFDRLKNKANEMADKANEAKNSAVDKANDMKNSATDKANEFKNKTNERIQEYVQELSELTPAIKELGYVINEIAIEIGIPPKIVPQFSRFKIVEEEIIESVLEKYKDKKISSAILSSLVKAASMQNLVNIGGFHFTDVEMELGLIPSVTIKFTPNSD